MKLTLIYLLIIFILILFNFNLSTKKEKFTNTKLPNSQNRYIINQGFDNEERTAVLYNINKYIKLEKDEGNALRFNGKNSYMVVPNINYNMYSISFIFKKNMHKKKQVLIASDSGGFMIAIENAYLTGTMYADPKVIKIAYGYPIERDKWYHFVLTFDGKNFKMYVNGNVTHGEILNDDKLETLIVGSDTNSKNVFDGYIGGFKVYNRILKMKELCSIHDMCKIIKKNVIESVEVIKNKAKCRFIPAGDTKAKCSEICSDKPNCNEEICKNLCNNCSDPEYCSWLKPEEKVCSFIPYGPSKVSCINTCTSEKHCDYLKCQNICLSCQDPDSCAWLEPPKRKKHEKPAIEPPPKYDPEGKPIAPKINVKTYNKKVKITWNRPYQGDAPIESYVCFIFKTFKMEEGVSINMVPFPKCEECVHIIDDLDKDETYTVGVRAYNKIGLSRMSNLESFNPVATFKEAKNIKSPKIIPNVTEYHFCKN